MPWKKENLHRYPANWSEIRARVQQLAGDKCENCGVRNYSWGYREIGKFHPISKTKARREVGMGMRPPFYWHGRKIIEIVCTTAHLDHTPENCDPSNLRFWCQKCHLDYDAKHHAQNAYQTRRKGRAVADLFEGSP
jgi:5-methylcytosine-specific restriction endonuclease McrA